MLKKSDYSEKNRSNESSNQEKDKQASEKKNKMHHSEEKEEMTNAQTDEKSTNDQSTKEAGTEQTGQNEQETVLKDHYDELYDKYIRLVSEFENYRKRTGAEKQKLIKTANENLVSELLPIMDDLERALESYEKSQENPPEGLKLIHDKFLKTLQNNGIEEIPAVGKKFDPEYHEAISQMQASGKKEKGIILNEVQKGYTLNGKIIRFAKVIVGA